MTLFTIPVSYDYKAGVHSPAYASWGYGLRYLEEHHAKRIVVDAFQAAEAKIDALSETEGLVTRRQLQVLSNIHARYFGSRLVLPPAFQRPPTTNPPEPDPESRALGERVVYEAELEYARKHSIPLSHIEWVSQAEPTAVYDIRSARIENGRVVEHYVEVKSTRLGIGENIIVSGRQIEFFRSHANDASVVLVSFAESQNEPELVYHAAGEFLEAFDFVPLKYKAVPKE